MRKESPASLFMNQKLSAQPRLRTEALQIINSLSLKLLTINVVRSKKEVETRQANHLMPRYAVNVSIKDEKYRIFQQKPKPACELFYFLLYILSWSWFCIFSRIDDAEDKEK